MNSVGMAPFEEFEFRAKPLPASLGVALILIAAISIFAWVFLKNEEVAATIGLLGVGLFILGIWYFGYRRAHAVKNAIGFLIRDRSLRRSVHELTEWSPSGSELPIIILKRAAQAGVRDLTLRLWSRNRATTPEPFFFPFEPKPLDEADSAFIEMHDSSSKRQLGNGYELLRKVDRSLKRKGGRRVLLAPGIYLVLAMCMILLPGGFRLVAAAIFVTSAIVTTIFLLADQQSLRRTHLIIPAGLVVRSNYSKRQGSLAVYYRRDCILCAKQLQAMWNIVVTDGRRVHRLEATPAETDMLLRAWLSPLDPPPLERLKDFE